MEKIDYETVREIALGLPNVEDGLSYGAPALKTRGQMFVRHREDLNAIVLRTTFEEREELIAAEPEMYFITEHYREYPYVLVSLEHVFKDALRELIKRSHSIVNQPKKRR